MRSRRTASHGASCWKCILCPHPHSSPNHPTQFRLLSKPCSIVRDMMLKLLSTLNVVSGRDSDDAHIFSVSAPVPVLRPAHPHHAAARDPGCRKSFLLLQAVHHALSTDWIMLYIPCSLPLPGSIIEPTHCSVHSSLPGPTCLSPLAHINPNPAKMAALSPCVVFITPWSRTLHLSPSSPMAPQEHAVVDKSVQSSSCSLATDGGWRMAGCGQRQACDN